MGDEKLPITITSYDFLEAILQVGACRIFLPTNIGGGRLRYGCWFRICRSVFFRHSGLCSVFWPSEFISVWADRSHEWMTYIDVRAGYIRGWAPPHCANVWGTRTQVTILSMLVIYATFLHLFLSFLLRLSVFILYSYHYHSCFSILSCVLCDTDTTGEMCNQHL
jgi:hypothetical protein